MLAQWRYGNRNGQLYGNFNFGLRRAGESGVLQGRLLLLEQDQQGQ
jgi:hypothetical protein